jgi:SAM-dependent methyltransferase
MGQYVFDHEWGAELDRLRLVQELFDPGTIRHLEAVGVGPGWRCLEVGAGAGSIAAWLARRVGPSGAVVATDLQTDFLDLLAAPGVDVRRHDIAADDLEEGAFDLIHARMVLQHVPERDHALKRMAAALAPGGVIVEEDLDCGSLAAVPGPRAGFFERCLPPLFELMQAGGYDPFYGRRLPAVLRLVGLTHIGADGWIAVGTSGSTAAAMWRLTAERFREPLIAGGHLTAGELDELLALHDDDDFAFLYPAMVTAWGYRPVSGEGR